MVNKARLIEKIAELVKDKRLEGISDIRDESNRNGMRIVIELKRDANPRIILNRLYKHTQLQETFSMIMLALVDGEPKILTLKEMLEQYLLHQKDVVTRRTQFDLRKAEARAHILGLHSAGQHRCDNKTDSRELQRCEAENDGCLWANRYSSSGHFGYAACQAAGTGTGKDR